MATSTNDFPAHSFVSYQMVCEVIPIHVDVAHVTTNVTVKHWNEISLYRPWILPALKMLVHMPLNLMMR